MPLKWSKDRPVPPADNVAMDKAGAKAFERFSDLDPDSKWPSPSSAPPTPRTARRKIRTALEKNKVPCDVIKPIENMTPDMVFKERGFDMNIPPTEKSLLGEGSFGKVILIYGNRRERLSLEAEEAADTNEKKVKYACKIIETKDKFEKRLREFGGELNGLNAGHSHPFIIQMFDAFFFNSKFYIVMEYGDEKTLHRYTSKKGPLEENRSRRFFQQIGSAVNFLHGQNIAHRDLKLQNVMLKMEVDPLSGNHRRVCKVTDMGLSDICWSQENGPAFSISVCGTRHAMAPEILENDLKKGSVPYNAIPADNWALGVMLYEMLCRALPFNTTDKRTQLSLQKKRNIKFQRKAPETPKNDRKKDKSAKPLPPLSEESKHLMRMLFDPDPLSRWTWREVSRHPWMQHKSKRRDPSATKDSTVPTHADVSKR